MFVFIPTNGKATINSNFFGVSGNGIRNKASWPARRRLATMTFRQQFFNYMCSFLLSVQDFEVKIDRHLFVNVDVYILISWQGKIAIK